MNERHSVTDDADIHLTADERAAAEARNALRQYDFGMMLLEHWLANLSKPPVLRISDLLSLNRFALEDVNKLAGTFRAGPVTITGSGHVPPDAKFVPQLVEEFCDYLERN